MSLSQEPHVNNFLERLSKVKTTGNGWSACCPAHDDSNPSLAIAIGDDRRILLTCHAGCTPEHVVAAIGLEMKDLFASKEDPTREPRIVAIYPYRNADSTLRFEVVRYDPKEFKQRRPDGQGGYIWNMKGVQRILYRLPELMTADPKSTVLFLEGEKDVDSAIARGFLATTTSGGAGKVELTDLSPLHGRAVAIIPDRDVAGRKHAVDVAERLRRKAADIRIVELPKGKDVTEFFEAGGTIKELQKLVDAAPPWDSTAQSEVASADLSPRPRAILMCAADVKPEEVDWLWPGRVPLGKSTLWFGDPCVGKSIAALDMAARVSTGSGWPDNLDRSAPGSVIILSAEDTAADTIVPRLAIAGAELRRIQILTGVLCPRDREVGFDLQSGLTVLRNAIKLLGDCKLVIIDPVAAFLGSGVDSHRNSDIRGVLGPLAALAADTGIAVVLIAHMTKSYGGKAMYRANGSLAFIAAARAAWLFALDPEDETRRLMLSAKNNLGPALPGLAFTIAGSDLNGVPAGHVVWLPASVTMTADEVLAREGSCSGRCETPAQDEAVELLKEMLKAGPVEVAAIKKEATRAGIGWRTVQRATKRLKIRATKLAFDGAWVWLMPAGSEQGQGRARETPNTNSLASFADSGALRVIEHENTVCCAPISPNSAKGAMSSVRCVLRDPLALNGVDPTGSHQGTNGRLGAAISEECHDLGAGTLPNPTPTHGVAECLVGDPLSAEPPMPTTCNADTNGLCHEGQQ